MSPENRTDHELLLQILDEMKPIRDFVRASSAVIWGKQDDSVDAGLVGRMKEVEKKTSDIDCMSKKNDERLDVIEKFVIALQVGMKTWAKILAVIVGVFSSLAIALIVSVVAFIWALITGEVTLLIP